MVVDANGLPIDLTIIGGQQHDSLDAPGLLASTPKGGMVLANRAYGSNEIRSFVATQGGWANIPPRQNRREPVCFSPYLYRHRNHVERFFNRIKHCGRNATRYEKRAANYWLS